MNFELKSWNAERILAKTKPALLSVGRALGEQAKTQISTTQFNWPNPTVRFTSLVMGGSPKPRAFGKFSPPTTKAGASNTKKFKKDIQNKKAIGNGIYIQKGLRDIVDTGELLRSQTRPIVVFTEYGAEVTIKWTAPYSKLVLLGGDYGSYVAPSGKIVNVGVKPGRDWITPTFQQTPILNLFIQAWR